jgi:exonuclease III
MDKVLHISEQCKLFQIVLLQETNHNLAAVKEIRNHIPSHIPYDTYTKEKGFPERGSGVITLLSRDWASFVTQIKHCQHRILSIDVNLPINNNRTNPASTLKIRIVNIYYPSYRARTDPHTNATIPYSETDNQLTSYLINLNREALLERRGIIMAGDWNTVVDTEIDRVQTANNTRTSIQRSLVLNKLIAEGLTDTYRIHHPSGGFTFKNSQTQSEHRLDVILCSRTLSEAVFNTTTLNDYPNCLDHKGVTAHFSIQPVISFSCNPTLLSEFTEQINLKKVTKELWIEYRHQVDEQLETINKTIEELNELNESLNIVNTLNNAADIFEKVIKQATTSFPKRKVYNMQQGFLKERKSTILTRKLNKLNKRIARTNNPTQSNVNKLITSTNNIK